MKYWPHAQGFTHPSGFAHPPLCCLLEKMEIGGNQTFHLQSNLQTEELAEISRNTTVTRPGKRTNITNWKITMFSSMGKSTN